ncbi:MAG: rhomboid family intramembrane serine protease [Bacteroidota bacterium]
MLQSIWDDIRREFDSGNMIKRIIIVNIAVYVVINLAWVFINHVYPGIYQAIIRNLAISASVWHIITHPWTLITHMFLHEGFMHILFNMLFLLWFGRIFGDLLGDRRVLPLYLLGGFAGALTIVVVGNLGMLPGSLETPALGASAAVMAILVAAGVFAPNYEMRLLFIGNVKLKWIVLALVFMNIVGVRGSNVGGAWGHLGGIALGFIYAVQLQRGNDLGRGIRRGLDWIEDRLQGRPRKKKRPGPRKAFRRGESVGASGGRRVKFRQRGQSKPSGKDTPAYRSHQEELDAILDKIKERGYDSLSDEEKAFLFKASEK